MLSILDKKYEQIISEFKNSFLSNPTDQLFSNIDDIGIIVDRTDKNKLIKTSFGPFSKKDIELRNLFPFILEDFSTIEKSVGSMVDITIFETISNFNEIRYTELVKIISDQSKLIDK